MLDEAFKHLGRLAYIMYGVSFGIDGDASTSETTPAIEGTVCDKEIGVLLKSRENEYEFCVKTLEIY